MNLLEVTGIDGSLFNWNNPQNGMSMLYSMRLLYLASKERDEASRLTQNDIDVAYQNNSFYSHFNSYCSNVNNIINRHKYIDLTIADGYDLRGYDEGGSPLYDGNSIAESLSWSFESLESYLSLDEGSLDFIKDRLLPVGHVSESFYLSLMYKVLHCFSRRMHLNGIVYNRNVEYYKAYSEVSSRVARYTDPQLGQSFQEMADTCNNQFQFRLGTRMRDYDGLSPSGRLVTPFWRYVLSYSIDPTIDYFQNPNFIEKIGRELYTYTIRSGTDLIERVGGMIDFKINNLCSSSNGLFYGQVAKNDGSYKAWIAGDKYSDTGWYDFQSVDGKYDSYEFYSDAGFLYKKIQDLPLSVNNNGFFTTDLIKMRDTAYSSFEEITEPEQRSSEGLSIQVMPYGDINDEYYSDFITEEAN